MAQLISVQKDSNRIVARRIAFRATFMGIPLMQDAAEAQQKAGYHPAGYGGPMDLKAVPSPLGGGKYEATWTCFDNCD